ncbi:hypothetical protein [uncultured Clostridium sp.]|uniref:hypothetical protein n=1 Tax=uncultured Clostridium sp. TaxID=59620 RepID=UPI0025EEF05E|nr:hypothetical protein [uncultured Clostridium sp.]
MEFNLVTTGIKLAGTTIKKLNVENNIVDIEKDATRSFGLNINEPYFSKMPDAFFSQMTIDFEVEVEQSENRSCKIQLSLEGAFISTADVDEDAFKQLVVVNGASAIISIARGKIETITSNIFDNGKVVIPFVNVIDYYKSLSDL